MKKEDVLSIFVYLVMLLIALFIGLRIISPAIGDLTYTQKEAYGFAILTIVVGVLINAIIFEVGHIVGALIGGYKILSVNILGLCVFRANKKWRVAIKGFNGLTGETRIFARRAKANPRYHLFGPIIMYLIEFVAAILLFVFLPKENVIHHASLIVAGIGAMLIIYNIMPFRLDTLTDGYYLMLLSKRVNIEAYNELMRIQSLVNDKEKIGEIKVFEQITTLTATVNMYKFYDYLDEQKYEEAMKILKPILENKHKLEPEIHGRALAQKLYLLLITKPKEAVELYWNDELNAKEKKFIANDTSMESLRSYLLFNGLVSKSESESAYVVSRVPKALKTRMDERRRQTEIDLFIQTLEIVRKENPNWVIEDPKIKK